MSSVQPQVLEIETSLMMGGLPGLLPLSSYGFDACVSVAHASAPRTVSVISP